MSDHCAQWASATLSSVTFAPRRQAVGASSTPRFSHPAVAAHTLCFSGAVPSAPSFPFSLWSINNQFSVALHHPFTGSTARRLMLLALADPSYTRRNGCLQQLRYTAALCSSSSSLAPLLFTAAYLDCSSTTHCFLRFFAAAAEKQLASSFPGFLRSHVPVYFSFTLLAATANANPRYRPLTELAVCVIVFITVRLSTFQLSTDVRQTDKWDLCSLHGYLHLRSFKVSVDVFENTRLNYLRGHTTLVDITCLY